MAALHERHHPVIEAVGNERARAGREREEAERFQAPQVLEGLHEGELLCRRLDARKTLQRLAQE